MPRGRRVEHNEVVFLYALLHHLGNAFHQCRFLHAWRVLTQRHVLVDFAAQMNRHEFVQRIGNLFHMQPHGLFGVKLQAV